MNRINTFIVHFVFKLTATPMRFKELLNANKIYHDGMNLENNIHGFKLRLGRAYLVFFGLFLLINIPVIGVLHGALTSFDSHVLIILTALVTGGFFILFSMFKEHLVEQAALIIIEKAWNKHLSLFPFAKYGKEVAFLYGQAVEEEIAIGNLQHYIFDKLSQK